MVFDTLIIGGGIAGLHTADMLAARGGSVAILEQSSTWGGRIATYRGEDGIQYEMGAGRIHKSHARVKALVERFGLKTFPITSVSAYEDPETHNAFLDVFEPIRRLLLTELAPGTLGLHTIADLIPPSMHHVLQMYPYWAEMHMLRADVALELFESKKPMGARGADDYYGIVEGIDTLTTRLQESAAAAGAFCRTQHDVRSIKRIDHDMFEITGIANKGKKPFKYTARRIVLATCRCSLTRFHDLLEDAPLFKQIGTSPLMRIYAVYPPDRTTGVAWFADLPKTVTSNPLRYVIPINSATGLIMISYTDGDDTNYWRRFKSEKDLQKEIQARARELFPSHTIPEPTFLRRHDWTGGCSYWLPGRYDVRAAAEKARNPVPGVYIVGESVSPGAQTWIEGALE